MWGERLEGGKEIYFKCNSIVNSCITLKALSFSRTLQMHMSILTLHCNLAGIVVFQIFFVGFKFGVVYLFKSHNYRSVATSRYLL